MPSPNEKTRLLEKFAAYLSLDRGLRPATVSAYVQDVREWLDTAPGELGAVTKPALEIYLAGLAQDRALSARSLARKLSSLRVFFRLSLQEKWCPLDPTAGLRAPWPSTRLPKTLEPQEVERLLEEPERRGNLADAIMLRTLYASGLRVSELVSVTTSGLDLAAGSLRVQGKGDKPRIVPIDHGTVVCLDHYLKALRPPRAAKCGERPHAALFLSPRGKPYTRQGFWKLIRRYATLAAIASPVSPHVLRHAFATHLLERGMSLRLLQALLGHEKISTTEIYSHVATSHLRETLLKHHPRGGKS